ncbi:MAG: hypothetical protein KDB12_16680 [Ilumatobacter sp.]|nr:hypothetical protein [Ilumatobacter sp.]
MTVSALTSDPLLLPLLDAHAFSRWARAHDIEEAALAHRRRVPAGLAVAGFIVAVALGVVGAVTDWRWPAALPLLAGFLATRNNRIIGVGSHGLVLVRRHLLGRRQFTALAVAATEVHPVVARRAAWQFGPEVVRPACDPELVRRWVGQAVERERSH